MLVLWSNEYTFAVYEDSCNAETCWMFNVIWYFYVHCKLYLESVIVIEILRLFIIWHKSQQVSKNWKFLNISFIAVLTANLFVNKFSSTIIHFHPFFIYFHPFLSIFIHRHPFLSIFIHHHPFSSLFSHFHPFHPLLPIFIHHHSFSSIFIQSINQSIFIRFSNPKDFPRNKGFVWPDPLVYIN